MFSTVQTILVIDWPEQEVPKRWRARAFTSWCAEAWG